MGLRTAESSNLAMFTPRQFSRSDDIPTLDFSDKKLVSHRRFHTRDRPKLGHFDLRSKCEQKNTLQVGLRDQSAREFLIAKRRFTDHFGQ